MSEPFDTVAASVVDTIVALIAETITESEAEAAISEAFQDAYPTETDKLTVIQSFVARLPGVNVGSGPPDPAFGQVGSQYLDELNYRFYRSKTAEGWGEGVAFLGAPGANGTSFLASVRDVLDLDPETSDAETLAAHAVLVAEELAAEGLISGSGANGNWTASGAGTTLTVSEPVAEASTLDLTKNGLPQVAGQHFSANGSDVITLSAAYAAGDKFVWAHVGGRAAAPQQIAVQPFKGTGETDGNLLRAAITTGEAAGKTVQLFGDIEVDGVVPGRNAAVGHENETVTPVHTEIKGSGPRNTRLRSKSDGGTLKNLIRQQNLHRDSSLTVSDLTLDGTDKLTGNLLSSQDASNFTARNVVLICGGITNRQNDNTRSLIANSLTTDSWDIRIEDCQSFFAAGHGFATSSSGTLHKPHVRRVSYQRNLSYGSAGSGLNMSTFEHALIANNTHYGVLDDVTGNFIYRYAAFRLGNEGAFASLIGNVGDLYYRGLRSADIRFILMTGNMMSNIGQQGLVFEQKDSEGHHGLATGNILVDTCRSHLHPTPESDGEEEPSNTTERMAVYQGGGSHNVFSDLIVSSDFTAPAHGVVFATAGDNTIRVVDDTEIGNKISAADRRFAAESLLLWKDPSGTVMRPIFDVFGKVEEIEEKLWYPTTDASGRPIGRADSRVPDPNMLLTADNPFATNHVTNEGKRVTITKVGHNLTTGDLFTPYGVKAFNGIDFLNADTGKPKGPYAITTIDADSFYITYETAATATGAGGGAGAENACGARVTNSTATTTKALLGTNPLETIQRTVDNPFTTFRPTLGSNPITTNADSDIIQITQVGHGKAVGEAVRIGGVPAGNIGGIGGIAHTDINGARNITNVIGPDTYWVQAGAAATTSATGGGAGVTIGSARVSVAIASHGLRTGEIVKFGNVTGDPGGAANSNFTNSEKTVTVIDSGTFEIVLANPVTSAAAGVGGAGVTMLTNEIKVTDTGHSMVTGSYVRLNHKTIAPTASALTAFNGIAIDGRAFEIVVLDANSYKMICETVATSAGTGGGSDIARSWVPKSAGQNVILDGGSLMDLDGEPFYYRNPQFDPLFYIDGFGSLTVDDANANVSASVATGVSPILLTQGQDGFLLFDDDKRLLGVFDGASSNTAATLKDLARHDFSGTGWFIGLLNKMTTGIQLYDGSQTVLDFKSIAVDGASDSPIQVRKASIMRLANIPRSSIQVPEQAVTAAKYIPVPIPSDMEDMRYRPCWVRIDFFGAMGSPSAAGWAFFQIVRIRAGVVTVLSDVLIPLGLDTAKALGDRYLYELPDTPPDGHLFMPGDLMALKLSPFGTGRTIPPLNVDVGVLPW